MQNPYISLYWVCVDLWFILFVIHLQFSISAAQLVADPLSNLTLIM